MTPTELSLIALYGPAVPLEAVCKVYFGLSYEEARRAAGTNDLPVPTFRLRDSAKAPLLMHTAELAAWIDKTAADSEAEWAKSQV
jgi:hypothetical protein